MSQLLGRVLGMRHLRRHKVSIAIIATYVITFILPLAITFAYLFPQLTRVTEQQMNSAAQSELNNIAGNFEQTLNAIYNYSASLSGNASLTLDVLSTDDPVSREIICRELKQTLSHNPYAAVTLLYNRNVDRYYSASASYRASWIHEGRTPFLSLEGMMDTDYVERLKSAEKLEILPQQTLSINGFDRECIVIVMPIAATPMALMLVIPTDSVCRPASEGDNILLINSDSQILAGSMPSPGPLPEALSYDALSAGDDSNRVTIDGEPYLIYRQSLKYGDLCMVSLYARDSIFRGIDSLTRSTMLILLLLFGIGAVLIFIGMLVSYFPLLRVRKSAIDTGATSHELTDMNEWDAITYALENLNSQNKATTEKLEIMQTMSQNLFLHRYLFGGIHDESYIIEMAKVYGIDIRDQLVCVAFACAAADKREALAGASQAIHSLCDADDNVSCYCIEGTSPADLLLVAFINDEADLKPYYESLYHMPPGVKAGIGSVETIQNPEKSLAMSLSALVTALFDDSRTVAGRDDISLADIRFIGKVFDQIELYDKSICQGKLSQVKALYEPLVKLLFSEKQRYDSIWTLYSVLHNTLAHHLNSFGCDYMPVYGAYDLPDGLENMRKCLDDMHARLMKCLESRSEESGRKAAIDQILDYINANYADPNMTLSSVAEQFGFSYSNFSHFFRNQTEQTFSSYLEQVRINAAKRLLDETDDVLSIIAAKVGYTNVNTFTRSFKKLEIITPGSYRSRAK